MDEEVDEGATERAREVTALEPLLVAPAAVLEGLPDAVVAAARDGRIVFVNALAEELFGYTKKELLGKPVETLWPERVRERYRPQHGAVLRHRASDAVLDRGVGAAA